ncbi:hypothetical protein NFI96_012822, partial [Prochilodus magdalenae]
CDYYLRMDSEDGLIEQAIDEELKKLSLSLSDISDVDSNNDTESEDDFTTSNGKLENDFPESVLTYFEASRNRVNTFEQLILEDLNENDTTYTELSHQNHFESLLNELAHNPEEDLMKLKERIICEIEEHVAEMSEADGSCREDTKPEQHVNDGCTLQRFVLISETERQLIDEWKELEEKLKKEEEQRLTELEAERKRYLNSAREEEEKRRRQLEKFEDELRKIEKTGLCEISEHLEGVSHSKESIQLELAEQQEVIMKLEVQLEEERHAYEEAQREGKKKSKLQQCGAAIKLQAAFRGVLVRRWSKNELIRRREEVRRRQEEIEKRKRRREKEERMKRLWEEEKKRAVAEEQREQEELELRRAEYEKAKEQERHRLDRERKLEEKKRQEEEAKRMDDERKRKEDEERRKIMEKEQKEEEKRRLEEEAKKQEVEKMNKKLESKEMQKEGIQLEEKQSKGEGNRIGRNEERGRWGMEERRIREKERKKIMEEHRMEEEKRHVEDELRKRKEEAEKKREEFESKQMQTESKQLEEKEGKEVEEKVKEKNEERDGQKMEERRIRGEETGKIINQENRSVEEQVRKSKDAKSRKLEEEENKRIKSIVKQEEQRTCLVEKESREEEGKATKRNEKRGGLEEAKRLDDQRCFVKNIKKSSEKRKERNAELSPQPCLSQSDKNLNGILASTCSSSNGPHQICVTIPTNDVTVVMTPALDHAQLESEMHVGKSEMDTRGHHCETADSLQNCAQNTSPICLPDSTEQKRLAWMMQCTPWSKLSMQNKRKGLTAPPRKRGTRRPSVPSLPPLSMDTVLKSGPWSTLRQVTTVTLEDLPGCSLSTLSECTSLQSLTLRRCGLRALEGLHQCSELRHIDVQQNNITYVDLEGLEKLEVLLLGRNQLTSIPDLGRAVNLTVLHLSHNIISRISGLESLKRLQRLSVDHNQLISTRGLSDAFTLLYLDCSYNHLSHMEGLEHCALLNTLDLRGNSLTELPVLMNHVLLRELYLDENSISSLHGLDSCWLPLLRSLSVAQNNITQLPLLMDLLSLKTLNISHNCLSELRNICLSLQGCTSLQELNLSDNPLQLENNWRLCVLAAKPSLIKLNGDLTGASVEPSVGSTQLWSFQALCQIHQDQLDSVLHRHSMEIRLASSVVDAQLLVRNHSVELFRLAEEQRYAHEYGDSSFSETAIQEPAASSCLQDVSKGDLAHLNSAEQEIQSQPKAHLTGKVHKTSPEHLGTDLPAGCAGGCINPLEKFREPQSGHSRRSIKASRMDLKNMAATVIQSTWRNYRQTRRMAPSGPPAKPNGKWSPQRRLGPNEKSPVNKDYAATVIQAVWRGYALRRRLAHALTLARISEGEEAFEEVDMDEFNFDEEAMESDWRALHSDASSSGLQPYSEQLLLPKPPLPLPELHKSTPVLPWKPKQAWTGSEAAAAASSEQSLSPDSDIRMQSSPLTLGLGALSERSEKILEEWGISSGSTARLMLKRAQKMKARNKPQKKMLDPVVRLALFRNHSKQPVPLNAQKRHQPECRDDIIGVAGRPKLPQERSDDSSKRSQKTPQQHPKNCRPRLPQLRTLRLVSILPENILMIPKTKTWTDETKAELFGRCLTSGVK